MRIAIASIPSGVKVLAVVALAVVLLLSVEGGAQAPTANAPTLRPGEFWVWQWADEFREKRSGNYRRTVVRKDVFEGQEVYIVSRGDGTFSVVTLDFVTVAYVDGAGNVKTRFGQRGDSPYPLFVGRVYTREYDNPVGQYRGTYKYTATGVEDVRTQAGTFMAFRVTEEGKGTFYNGRAFTENGVFYFAPAAKVRIKYSYSVDTGYKYSDELTNYQILPD